MSTNAWLQFAGLLNDCIYQLEHENCPFNKYRKMDHYQRMDFLLSISDKQATAMMNSCLRKQGECSALVFQKEPSGWGIALAIS
jgi:hypothetical protein